MLRSIASRLLLASLVVTVLSLSVAGWVISLTFEDTLKADMDTRLRAMLDTMIGVSEIDKDGLLRFNRPVLDQRFDEPFSGFYWQISEENQDPFRSRSLWDQALDTNLDDQSLRGRFGEKKGPEGQRLRVLEQDIILPDNEQIYRYMVALDTAQITQSIQRFDGLLLMALVFIGVIILLALGVQIIFGLRPLRRFRRQVQSVRTGVTQTIEGDYPRELFPVVEEVNALIGHNSTVLERARTHVGNLAHALKTPLSILKNAAHEAEEKLVAGQADQSSGVAAQIITDQVDTMQQHVDHHLKRARVAGRMRSGGVQVAKNLNKMQRAMAVVFRDRPCDFHISCAEQLVFAGEQEDLNEVIGNLFENACKYGGGQAYVTVTAQPNGRFFTLSVEDNGPGVSIKDCDQLFERGVRLDSQEKGSGLGLSIVADVVAIYGGQVQASKSERYGGLKITLSLPMLSVS